MTINIQSVHFNADSKLLDFVNEKVNKLTTYYDGII
nr:HPF/RaiA family ribosome-associated protein [Bacteroidota bacterium]